MQTHFDNSVNILLVPSLTELNKIFIMFLLNLHGILDFSFLKVYCNRTFNNCQRETEQNLLKVYL